MNKKRTQAGYSILYWLQIQHPFPFIFLCNRSLVCWDIQHSPTQPYASEEANPITRSMNGSNWSKVEFLNHGTIDICCWIILCLWFYRVKEEDYSVHCKMFSNILDHYPLDDSSTPSSPHCDNQNCFQTSHY